VDLEAQPHVPETDATPDTLVSKVQTFRRPKRSQTSSSYRPKAKGRVWKPGQEPGIDPSGNHPTITPTSLHTNCDITVVDFSQKSLDIQYLDNSTLQAFLDEPRAEANTCRWINVNGLSWDVISLIGTKKKFHRLAIEDLLNPRNRTKADWYSDHTYSELSGLFVRLPSHLLLPSRTSTAETRQPERIRL
jgi:hypothetical protein